VAKRASKIQIETKENHELPISNQPITAFNLLNVRTLVNIYINLEPDSRAETDRLFAALSAGGKVGMPLQDMFWGAYFGSCTDKFGVQWMFNCAK
jgi:uncharacterized glyoxalase superfamily protein PhnB